MSKLSVSEPIRLKALERLAITKRLLSTLRVVRRLLSALLSISFSGVLWFEKVVNDFFGIGGVGFFGTSNESGAVWAEFPQVKEAFGFEGTL